MDAGVQDPQSLRWWGDLAPAERNNLKSRMFKGLWSQDPIIRIMNAEVIGIVGGFEYLYREWRAYFRHIIAALVDEAPLEVKLAMLKALEVAARRVGGALSLDTINEDEEIQQDMLMVLQAAVQLLMNGNAHWKVAVLEIIPTLCLYAYPHRSEALICEVFHEIAIYTIVIEESTHVIDAAIDCLDKLVQLFHPLLQQRMDALLRITSKFKERQELEMHDRNMLHIIDLWTTIAATEKASMQYHNKDKGASIVPLQAVFLAEWLLTIMSCNGTDDSWTVGKAAAVCLENCLAVAPHQFMRGIIQYAQFISSLDDAPSEGVDAALVASSLLCKNAPSDIVVQFPDDCRIFDLAMQQLQPVKDAMAFMRTPSTESIEGLGNELLLGGGTELQEEIAHLFNDTARTLQCSAMLFFESVAMNCAHLLQPDIVQELVSMVPLYLKCPIPQLAARAAWLAYAIFLSGGKTANLSWWETLSPTIADVIQELLAAGERYSYDSSFVRQAAYEAIAALYLNPASHGFLNELVDIRARILSCLLGRAATLMSINVLSEMEATEHINHTCSVLGTIASLASSLGKRSTEEQQHIISLALHMGSVKHEEIVVEALNIMSALASTSEAGKVEMATDLPKMLPIVIKALHTYDNEPLCQAAVGTLSVFLQDLESEMSLYCSPIVQNVIRALSSDHELSIACRASLVDVIGDAALNLPKHFKRHAEESCAMLVHLLESVSAANEFSPHHWENFVEQALDIQDDPVRKVVYVRCRRKKSKDAYYAYILRSQYVDLVCSIIQAFSCVVQGLNAEEAEMTSEELVLLLPSVLTCLQMTMSLLSHCERVQRVLCMLVVDYIGLCFEHQSLSQEERLQHLQPIFGIGTGYHIAEDIVQSAIRSGVEPSLTDWVTTRIREAEAHVNGGSYFMLLPRNHHYQGQSDGLYGDDEDDDDEDDDDGDADADDDHGNDRHAENVSRGWIASG